MALIFPSNPTLNQVYSTGSLSWTWNGKSWNNGTSILVTSNLVSSSVQFTNGNTNAFDTTSNITVGQITASFAKISGSIFGTASFAILAQTSSYVENAQTASYVVLAQTASYVLNAVSASYSLTASYVALAQTASYVENAQTASCVTLAQTASYVTLSQTASYISTASYALAALSASYAPNIYVLPSNVVSSSAQHANGGGVSFDTNTNITVGQITASFAKITNLTVEYVTSSVMVITGSNKFGDASNDKQEFTGSVSISGSLSVTGALNTSGTITSTATGDIFSSTAATTTEKFSRFNNTGGATKWGTESSVGGTIFLGTTAYASVFGSALNNPVQIASNNSVVATVSSTGLAVTGTLSATGNTITFGTDNFTLTDTYFGYVGNSYRVLRVGTNASQRSVALCVDPSTITGGSFSGSGQILIPNNGILAPNSAGTDWMGVLRATGGNVIIGPVLTSGELVGGVTGTMTMSSTGLAVTGTLSATGGASITGAVSSANAFVSTGVVTANGADRVTLDFGSGAFGRVLAWGPNNATAGQLDLGVLSANATVGSTSIARISSTGLAVTGTLSSTGILSGPGFRASKTTATSGLVKIQDEGANVYNVIGSRNNADNAALPLNFQATNFDFNGAVAVTGALSATSNSASAIAFFRNDNTSGANTPLIVAAINRQNSATHALKLSVDGNSNPYLIANGSTEIRFGIDNGGYAEVARITSTGLAVTGNTKSTFPGSTGGSPGYGFWAQDSTDASGAGFAGFAKASGTVIGSITRVTTTDAVAYNTTSDGRLKENLRDFTDSGRLIDALKPRVFDWKNSDENGKNVVGFVAQEEHAADPIFAHIGAVSVGDEDAETITKQWQRSDSALIPILVAELKALRQRVAALEAK